jgi:membrane protein implicated in regulation of membrane protease activity
MSSDLWPWWIAAAIALGIAELFTGDLIFLMIAVGSLAAALAAYLDVPVVFQVLIGGVTALLLLTFVRPLAMKLMRPKDETATNTPRLIGKPAVVLEEVHERDGRVKLDGEVWSARTDDPSVTLNVGADVTVLRIDGATAIVGPKEVSP